MQAKIDQIMQQVEERAILARRPYPPVDLPGARSQVGGLPILRSDTDWPRTRDGTPLHFLARIDCSELPEPRGPLPSRGVLQFFARIDEEMVWDGDDIDHARVLYEEADVGRSATPPADLKPILGGWLDYDREMRLPDEPKTRVYPRWPLTFESIRSWPMDLAIDPDSGVTEAMYRAAVERARAAEIVRVTGWPTSPLLQPTWGEWVYDREGKRILTLPRKPADAAEFPQVWVIAERIVRAMACLSIEKISELQAKPDKAKEGAGLEKLRADFEAVAQQSLAWVRRAQMAGLDAPMTDDATQQFGAWLKLLSSSDRVEIRGVVQKSLQRGMSRAVKYCGGSSTAAALMPPYYMNCLEREHSLTSPDTFGILVKAPRRRIRTWHHQLLGHAPASQDVSDRAAKNILLLHLVSDPGVDFSFCDCGEVQFWIAAEDLAARRFERAIANTQGG